MGSLGNSIRSLIRSLINNASIRSSMTLTPITRTQGSDGGYGAPTEIEGTSSTVYCIPTNYVQDRIEQLKIGDVKTGETSVIIRDNQSIDTDDKVTFEGSTFKVDEIRPIIFNEVTVGTEIILTKELG